MADLSFLPFGEGDQLTAYKLNNLISAISDGTIFVPGNIIGEFIAALGARVYTLENKVAALENYLATQNKREQYILTHQQAVLQLEKVPQLDSELLVLNGLTLSRDEEPLGVLGDYTLAGKIITLTSALALNVIEGDRLTVVYRYEV